MFIYIKKLFHTEFIPSLHSANEELQVKNVRSKKRTENINDNLGEISTNDQIFINQESTSQVRQELPFPDYVPVTLCYLKQTSRPRNWCLQMISNPYPFHISFFILFQFLNVSRDLYSICFAAIFKCDLLFVICDLRFVICYLRFAICYLRFAICDLRFVVCCLLSQ